MDGEILRCTDGACYSLSFLTDSACLIVFNSLARCLWLRVQSLLSPMENLHQSHLLQEDMKAKDGSDYPHQPAKDHLDMLSNASCGSRTMTLTIAFIERFGQGFYIMTTN